MIAALAWFLTLASLAVGAVLLAIAIRLTGRWTWPQRPSWSVLPGFVRGFRSWHRAAAPSPAEAEAASDAISPTA